MRLRLSPRSLQRLSSSQSCLSTAFPTPSPALSGSSKCCRAQHTLQSPRTAQSTVEKFASNFPTKQYIPPDPALNPEANLPHGTKVVSSSQHAETSKDDHLQSLLRSFLTGRPVGLILLSRAVFALTPRIDILHRFVVWRNNLDKQGTRSTKSRAEARGSGKKIRKQKGSGRARLGVNRSPMLNKGGRAHGPHPHTPATLLQRKVRALALRSALSAKAKQNQLILVDTVTIDTHRTTAAVAVLEAHNLTGRKVLLVAGSEEPPLKVVLATNNIQNVTVREVGQVDARDVLQCEYLVVDVEAVEWWEATLKPGKRELARSAAAKRAKASDGI
ncbi:ribosomal protein L4 [Gonapodya prolifera JEL478]|uniref:Large ribosomal subunit protein uL4m n=1 Tax=Gonapodya prolifera (strain JEL478) TaxID=1344416 RepID=A0A139AS15_GONPJ|nr:ribosomal protein L4 [Gonapodya prolifera JEL478]|eukprot:KXS19546.1 ribosomal protein L4 [Gonapodya prolifera JEL478]